MAITVNDALAPARDQHQLFDKRISPNQGVLRHLNAYQRQLVGKIIEYNHDALATKVNVAYQDSYLWTSTGYTLPAHEMVIGGTINFSDTDTYHDDLNVVKYSDRLNPGGAYPAYILDQTLFLCGYAQDWLRVASIDLMYVPLATALTALTSAFTLPDTALTCLISEAARFLARRAASRPEGKSVPLADFINEALEAEARFLQSIGAKRQAGVHYVREVW